MGGSSEELTGPDLAAGVPLDTIADGGMLAGHAHGEPVLLVRRQLEVFAIGAKCTHYGGPLAEGRLEGDEVRCPWHHACFDIRSGAALAAPALNPVPCWNVVHEGANVRVAEKREATPRDQSAGPGSVLVVGAGAAGEAAVEMLRREGYRGPITLVGAEASVPVDRPNLSKDYLAGTAPEEWIPLRPESFFVEHDVTLHLGATVRAIDVAAKSATLEGGRTLTWDALLLATGAEPIRLPIPGAERALTLRSLADSRAIITRAERAKRAVVLGASFIGLEVAASLRARGIEVAVVAPEAVPLARVLGEELGGFLLRLHQEKGVTFHLGHKPASIDESAVTLDDGTTLPADLVVMGVGVRPRTALAEAAGLQVNNGIVVDTYLATSAPGVFAAGDVASVPDPRREGERLRVEHWVVAQRQGQVAARNMLGRGQPASFAPFFWSNHYDLAMGYVGHATSWDHIERKGSLETRDCLFGYRRAGKIQAVASIGRDRDCLAAEAAMERGDEAALDALFAS